MAELRLIGGLLLALGLATVAAADPIQPPAGWTLGPDTTRQVYTPPLEELDEAVVLAVFTGTSTDSRYPQDEIDRLHAVTAARRAEHSGVVEDRWSESRHDKLIDATLAVHFDGAIEIARTLVTADRTHAVAVVGTCVEKLHGPAPATWLADPPPPGAFGDCRRALATLDTGIAPADRVAIDDAPPEPMSKLPELGGPAHMGDGSHIKLPPIAVPPPESTTDTRPMYIGAGLVVLAAAMWWNRRRRERVDDDSTDLSDAAKGSDHDDR